MRGVSTKGAWLVLRSVDLAVSVTTSSVVPLSRLLAPAGVCFGNGFARFVDGDAMRV